MWKKIPGTDGAYEINADGELRGYLTNKGRQKLPKPIKHKIKKKGYHFVCLSYGGKAKYKHVHRLVLETYIGPAPEGHDAAHLNGDPGDNRLQNLSWMTRKENHAQKHEHGTALVGMKHRDCKLNDELVLKIRALYLEGYSQAELAREFKLKTVHIYKLVHRKIWKHI